MTYALTPTVGLLIVECELYTVLLHRANVSFVTFEDQVDLCVSTLTATIIIYSGETVCFNLFRDI